MTSAADEHLNESNCEKNTFFFSLHERDERVQHSMFSGVHKKIYGFDAVQSFDGELNAQSGRETQKCERRKSLLL